MLMEQSWKQTFLEFFYKFIEYFADNLKFTILKNQLSYNILDHLCFTI